MVYFLGFFKYSTFIQLSQRGPVMSDSPPFLIPSAGGQVKVDRAYILRGTSGQVHGALDTLHENIKAPYVTHIYPSNKSSGGKGMEEFAAAFCTHPEAPGTSFCFRDVVNLVTGACGKNASCLSLAAIEPVDALPRLAILVAAPR
jgi:hypothetical protein